MVGILSKCALKVYPINIYCNKFNQYFLRFIKGNHVKVESKGGAPVEYVLYQSFFPSIHSDHSHVFDNVLYLSLSFLVLQSLELILER